jgi:hypothetical protein
MERPASVHLMLHSVGEVAFPLCQLRERRRSVSSFMIGEKALELFGLAYGQISSQADHDAAGCCTLGAAESGGGANAVS